MLMPSTKQTFKKYLEAIKAILKKEQINTAPCFISYAWEKNSEENKQLQSWLSILKEDLEAVGIKTFLDTCNMHGAMRNCMEENIKRGGYVLLIGTPTFKERIEQDKLYKMPRSAYTARKRLHTKHVDGKAVVFIDGEDTIYFIEDGQVLHKERTMAKDFNIKDGIVWRKIDDYDTYCADLNKRTNEIIDKLKSEVEPQIKKVRDTFCGNITNVAFEFGFTLEKGKQESAALIPLLYKGNFNTSFPGNILKEDLIRDMRNPDDYCSLLIGLRNPLGIIPAMCQKLIGNKEYQKLIESFTTEASSEAPSSMETESPLKQGAHMDTRGMVTLNLNIPAKELTIEKELGRGGCGIVYGGKRKHNQVAIKELNVSGVSKRILEEFKKEALIMFQLGSQCPQLVRLFGVCFEHPYRMVMELLKCSLYDILHDNIPLDWSQKEAIAKDIAIGLEFLHDNEVIHRDIKSLNVLLTDALSAKLADYGLARLKQHSTISCSAKNAVGTLPWMAPELLSGEEDIPYSFASDVYSYGLVLWEIATHKIPFEQASSGVLIARIINGKSEPIPEATPLYFSHLINRCRNKLPYERPSIAIIIQSFSSCVEISSKTAVQDVVLKTKKPSCVDSIGYSSLTAKSIKENDKHKEKEQQDNIVQAKEETAILSAELEKMELNKDEKPATAKFGRRAEFQSLTTSSLSTFKKNSPSSSSKLILSQHKQIMFPQINEQDLTKFLKHVVCGEQDEAEDMLKANPNLAAIHGDFADCAKREFKQATGFQYAVWALDWHMWKMLRKHIPTEETIEQLIKLENEGIDVKEPKASSYTKTKQVSWQKLIGSLQMYIDNHEAWSVEQCRDHWCQHVGGAQLTLPAHVIQEYSRKDRSFYPRPKFNEIMLPRVEDCDIAGWFRLPSEYEREGEWNSYGWPTKHDDEKLGKDFAWYRGSCSVRTNTSATSKYEQGLKLIYCKVGITSEVCSDLNALTALFKIRQKQRDQLILEYDITTQAIIYKTLTSSKGLQVNSKKLTEFLHHIGWGEQEEAEEMLEDNPKLNLLAGDLKDCAKRQFKNITGFQYAVWALDYHMWEMLKKYLPEDAIREQLAGLENGEWVYEHGSMVSWLQLINALKLYVDNYDSWTQKQRIAHWVKQVGGTQLNVPAHIIQEYSRKDRSFYPCPQFDETVFPRAKKKENNFDFAYAYWYSSRGCRGGFEKLGRDKAWLRSSVEYVLPYTYDPKREDPPLGCRKEPVSPDHDRIALTTLFDVRQKQRVQLMSEYVIITKATSSKILILPKNASTSPGKRIEQQDKLKSPEKIAGLKSETEFLKHVGWGNQDEAEEMLKKDIELALIAGDLEDCANRNFKNITGFQYAVWVLDYHMWTMIKKYLTKEQAKEQIEVLTKIATLEYQKGWVIKTVAKIKWISIEWKQLTEALFAYIHISEEDINWCKQIGGVQLILPAHAINEYSHPSRPLHPHPNWGGPEEPVLPRTGVIDWKPSDGYCGKLGQTFAWCRGDKECLYEYQSPDRSLVEKDYVALVDLLRSRMDQAQALVYELMLIPTINNIANASHGASSRSSSSPILVHYQYSALKKASKVTLDGAKEEYDLCLMSELPKNNIPEHKKVYLKKEDNKLKYIVLDPVTDNLIEDSLDIIVPQYDVSKEFLNRKRKDILEATSKRGHTPTELMEFLKHIGWGHQHEVEEMIKKNTKLGLASGDLEDCAKRKFKSITGFQYAVWALDYHMWEMLKRYMSPQAIREQLISLEVGGWVKEHSNMASWQELIDALKAHFNHGDSKDSYNNDIGRSLWRKVGKAQSTLPAHVIREYSREDLSFDPCPRFNEIIILPRREDWDIKGWFTEKYTGNLGERYAWAKGNSNKRKCICENIYGGMGVYYINNYAEKDIIALTTLFELRQQQRTRLLSEYVQSQKATIKPKAATPS